MRHARQSRPTCLSFWRPSPGIGTRVGRNSSQRSSISRPDGTLNRNRPNDTVDHRRCNQYQLSGSRCRHPTAYFTSRNGGRGFRFADTPTLWPYTTGADPGLSVADNGTIFYTYLGETPEYCSGGRSAVLLTKSFDHGIGFGTPAVVDANPADDKPALAVRSGPPGHAHVFSSWTRWYSKGSDIWFARSTDGGAHFARARRLYGSRLDNFGSDSVVT